jgi:hypothetical protein
MELMFVVDIFKVFVVMGIGGFGNLWGMGVQGALVQNHQQVKG